MNFDIYIIILTAFGMFGIYCFIDMTINVFSTSKFPPSVLVLRNSDDEKTMKKVKYAQENLPNNYTVFYPFEDDEDREKQLEKICGYIEDVLDVKNVNNW
ncbi:MAG: hypothetical protein IKB62_02555 [Oscillospiraceae bacterium]|nr:hypothetical protein [Oscillospiraceae bacterium]